MINDYSERHYPFEGCFNFRDIGGYLNKDGRRVKKGLYFRAGRQDRMTNKDLAKLADLNIATQIDLRKQEEVIDQGKGPLKTMGANYINISVIPEGGSDKLNKATYSEIACLWCSGAGNSQLKPPPDPDHAIGCVGSLPFQTVPPTDLKQKKSTRWPRNLRRKGN